MQCVTTVSYTFVRGLNKMGPICPGSGIRQGDPLSPFLFILCGEGLKALIRKYERRKQLQGIKICRNAPVISHMLFADDRIYTARHQYRKF